MGAKRTTRGEALMGDDKNPTAGPAGWFTAAFASQAFLLAYLEVVEWVDLYPWNDVRQGNGQETLDVVLGVVMAGALAATYFRWRPGMIGAFALYLVWFGLQAWTFWIPYAFGASERWARIHAANFAKTVQWLPTYGKHLPPDANHFVLQLLLVAVLLTIGVAAWRRQRDAD